MAPLGAGGMGEVYRAHDTRLGRDVALKVLPQDFTSDPERLARFEREARVLAALNHPHIAAIHGIEEGVSSTSQAARVTALVLELVEGDTLDVRLAQHLQAHHAALPFNEAVDIARQIAEALEAAHEKGIIHRDLKPANIKVAPDGSVKVLDFGLAKVVDPGGEVSAPSDLTTAVGESQEGLIVGTVGYMSPEQARGRPVDKRTDIWAFGCVLFELLSGIRAFPGQTVSDAIAAVLEREPAWDRLPDTTPRSVRRVLGRCLEKDPRRRLRDIGDARIELEEAFERPEDAGHRPVPPAGITRRTAIAGLLGAAAGGAGMALVGGRGRSASAQRGVARFAMTLPEGHRLTSSHLRRVAISPDGRQIALNLVPPGGGGKLFVRSLTSLDLRQPGEGVAQGSPFFSPDSRSLGYLAVLDGQWVRRVALSGGAPVTVCSFTDSQPAGATWATDDTIYFVSAIPGAIVRVPATGGEPTEVLAIDFAGGERLHKFPHALPGGRAILFTLATEGAESYDDTMIAGYDTATRQRTVLVEGGTAPSYSPSGHLVYARAGKLLAVPFDADRLEVTGQAFTVLDGVMMSRNTGVTNFDISSTGDLVYVPGQADGGARNLFWVDRSGKADRLPLPPRSYLRPRLSPDGRRLAIEVEGSNHDIFVFDFASGVLSNITTDGQSHWPVWSPDGARIGYRSGPMGRFRLFEVPVDRSGPAKPIPADGPWQSVESYSPDGRTIAYTSGRSLGPTIKIAPVDGDRAPQPLDDTRFAQGSAKFSPEGRWLAYCSNEGGRPHVYVQAFPPPGPKVQVSTEGGTDPVWRRDGKELFYRQGDRMMAVPVSVAPTFSAGRPHELWRGPYSHGMSSSCGAPGITSSNYDVTPDGQRFLMIQDDDVNTASATEVVLVQGWSDEVRRLGGRT